ncbi:hypothetical protein [Janibacter sp. GS2]|uniref:hypothetical protein n=1 Tax=Janibacter sp. GS2 TaxID=3442646 RepID=UPI003EB842C1
MGDANLSDLLLPVLLALPGLLAWLGTQSRRDRKRSKRMQRDIDEHEAWAIESRRARRIHNDQEHQTGVGMIEIPDLPSSMTRGDDDE